MKRSHKLLMSIAIIIIFGILSLFLFPKSNNEVSKDKLKETTEVIENIYYSDTITIKQLEKQMNSPLVIDQVFSGPDSSLRLSPDASFIKKNNLISYKKEQDKYADIVEKEFKTKTKYSGKNTEEGNIIYTIKPWYFYNYSTDLGIMTNKLLEKAGFDTTDLYEWQKKNNNEFTLNYFKAQVIAMRILNEHLTDYDNKDEEVYFTMYFRNDIPLKDQYFTLYCNLSGETSKYSPIKVSNYEMQVSKKLDNYINLAINKKLINKDILLS